MTCANLIILACTLHPIIKQKTPITNRDTDDYQIIKYELSLKHYPGITVKINLKASFQIFIFGHISYNIDNLDNIINWIIFVYNEFNNQEEEKRYNFARLSLINIQGSGIITYNSTFETLFYHKTFRSYIKELFFPLDPITLKYFKTDSNPIGLTLKTKGQNSMLRLYKKSGKYTLIAKSVKDFIRFSNTMKTWNTN